MKLTKILALPLVLPLALGLLVAMPAIAGHHTQAKASNDIVDTAINAGSFKTLTAALQAAGLVDVLRGDGPFTVFAPTDDAFAKLPAGTVESLLEPENKHKLVDILKYHVVAGEVKAKDAAKARAAATVAGGNLGFNYDGDTLRVNEATIVKADIGTSNGVIHVIDSVLLP